MRVIHAHLLLALLVASSVAAQGPGYKLQFSSVTSGRPQGSVLVLDVSSLWQKHPQEPQLSVQDAGECQRRCSKLPGCTAWAFCKDKNGCGTGCSTHTIKNPEVSAASIEGQVATKRGERMDDTSTYRLPINRFGPFSPNKKTHGCQADKADKWAFGTCTLIKAAEPRQAAPAAQGTGWVHAYLASPLPLQCGGLSAAACAACSSSPDPAACLSCMRDKRATGYVEAVSLVGDRVPRSSVGGRTLDQCLACAKIKDKAQHRQCTTCVLDRMPCASCIPYPGLNMELSTAGQAACMSCVEARGKRFTGSCLTCSASPDPSKCVRCLSNFYPKFTCTSAEYLDCYKPDFDNPCAMCQKVTGSNYDACISCFSQPKSRTDCESCSALPSPTAQSACFSCSAKVPALNSDTPGGCGRCYTQSKNSASLDQCVSCLTKPGTTPEKRRFCSTCSSSQLSGEQSSQCFKCLEGKSGNSGCSTCSTSAASPEALNACMTCHAYKANGPDCRDCNTLGTSLAPGARDALRKRCWDCVTASKLVVPEDAAAASLGSCQACFSSKSADTSECVACNTNALVPTAAKGWCVACAIKPPGDRSGCMKCLTMSKLTPGSDYRNMCSI